MASPNGSPAVASGKPRLLDQVRQRCRLRHLALSTEHAYVGWIVRYILFHHKRHPLEMGAAEVTEFLTHLAAQEHVATSTQNQALSALLFLYREVLQREFGWLDGVVRAQKPKRLPVVFTPEEAMGSIEELQGVRWLMAMLLYGGGLRLMECHVMGTRHRMRRARDLLHPRDQHVGVGVGARPATGTHSRFPESLVQQVGDLFAERFQFLFLLRAEGALACGVGIHPHEQTLAAVGIELYVLVAGTLGQERQQLALARRHVARHREVFLERQLLQVVARISQQRGVRYRR
jgi:hypothetical protein